MQHLYLDIRTKQSAAELKREIVGLMNGVKDEVRNDDPEFEFDVDFYLTQPGAEVEPDHALVKCIESAHQRVHGQSPGQNLQRHRL